MSQTERIHRIHALIRSRGTVSMRLIQQTFEISRATARRDLDYLRERLQAPLVWDRARRGYRYDEKSGEHFELTGMWFSSSEVVALLTMEHLLANLEPGLLGSRVEPLRERLESLLGAGEHSADEIRRRVRLIHLGARRRDPRFFAAVAAALLARRRLRIAHYSRERDEITAREVSPQRLVHYRENWYLDAWCHARGELRSFGVDAIREAHALDAAAIDVGEADLDAHFKSGYGIFGGTDVEWARLRFTPERARWVAAERWHAAQRSRFDADGSYLLEVPYADRRELVGDILRHGADCVVEAPASLRRSVEETIERMRERYAAARTSDGATASRRAAAAASRRRSGRGEGHS